MPGEEAETLQPGDAVEARQLKNIHGQRVTIPDSKALVHLQFRRYAGCPVCNLHLRSFAVRNGELTAAGVKEVAVFHSTAERLRDLATGVTFDVIADPARTIYDEFRVQEMKPSAMLKPRSWFTAARALTQAETLRGASGRGETHLGLPAGFLVGLDGRLAAVNYGQHLDDQWSVDEVIELATAQGVGDAR